MSREVAQATAHQHDPLRRRVQAPPDWEEGDRHWQRPANPEQLGPALTAADNGGRDSCTRHLQSTAGNRAVQRMVEGPADAEEAPDLAERIDRAGGGGRAIERQVRRKLERGLGASLEDVRIHDDAEADTLSNAVGAVAFTTGSDIFFRQGAYEPRSRQGLRLLAHEASHTVQQAAGDVDGTPVGGVSVSHPGDHFEQSAERAAERVMTGHVAPAASVGRFSEPTVGQATAVQRFNIGNVTRGAWDAMEAMPGGNLLSLGTGVGHAASSVVSRLQGDEEEAKRSRAKMFDNMLNAIPYYGNMRAGRQAMQNFRGENPEEAFHAPGGGRSKIDAGMKSAQEAILDFGLGT